MKKSTTIWLWGLITGIVSILFYQVLYSTGTEDTGVRWFNMLILFLGLFIGTMQYRKANGGYLTYGQAYKAGFLILLIIAVLSTIAAIANIELHPDYIDKILAQSRDNMINKGMTDDQIQAGMKVARLFTSAPILTLLVLFSVLFFGAILCLITSGLCTRNKPMFEDTTNMPGNNTNINDTTGGSPQS